MEPSDAEVNEHLGDVYKALGRTAEAHDAYEKGVQQARKHGHPSMAAEFEQVLEEMDS